MRICLPFLLSSCISFNPTFQASPVEPVCADCQSLPTGPTAITCVPTPEQCNNLDDDCDGQVDQGLTRPCTGCNGNGVETCTAGAFGGCTAPIPQTERCNGIDDDCDGDVDENLGVGTACDGGDSDTCALGVAACDGNGALVCTETTQAFEICNACNSSTAVPNTRAGGFSTLASASNGNGWGLAWNTGGVGNVFFSMVDADGRAVAGSTIQLSNASPATAKAADIAWNGTVFAVVWMEDATATSTVFMRRVSAQGVAIDAQPISVSSRAVAAKDWFPKIAWHEKARAWFTYFECGPSAGAEPVDICVRKISEDLTSAVPIFGSDPAIIINTLGGSHDREINLTPARVGDDFVLGITHRELTTGAIFGCVTPTGWMSCTSAPQVFAGPANAPDIAFNGSEFRVFWNDAHTGTDAGYSNTIALNGTLGSTAVPVGATGFFFNAMWDGDAYQVVWHAPIAGGDREVQWARVNNQGNATRTVRITNALGDSDRPSITPPPTLIGWFDTRAPAGAYFTATTCNGL